MGGKKGSSVLKSSITIVMEQTLSLFILKDLNILKYTIVSLKYKKNKTLINVDLIKKSLN